MKLSTIVLLLIFFVPGCAGIDWDSRVGFYSYDDAIREYGPPEKCEAINPQEKICTWISRMGPGFIDKLILSFGPDNKLKDGKMRRM